MRFEGAHRLRWSGPRRSQPRLRTRSFGTGHPAPSQAHRSPPRNASAWENSPPTSQTSQVFRRISGPSSPGPAQVSPPDVGDLGPAEREAGAALRPDASEEHGEGARGCAFGGGEPGRERQLGRRRRGPGGRVRRAARRARGPAGREGRPLPRVRPGRGSARGARPGRGRARRRRRPDVSARPPGQFVAYDFVTGLGLLQRAELAQRLELIGAGRDPRRFAQPCFPGGGRSRWDGVLPTQTLLAEWPHGQDAPTDYWISNLPATTPTADLVRWAKMRWRIELNGGRLLSSHCASAEICGPISTRTATVVTAVDTSGPRAPCQRYRAASTAR